METQELEAPRLKRKGLIAGGLGALAAVVVGRPQDARAFDVAPSTFLLGGRNAETSETVFELEQTKGTALAGVAPEGGIGLLGVAGTNDVSLSNPSDIQAGSWSYGKNAFGSWSQSEGKPGALAISDMIGVLGIAGMYGDAPDAMGVRAGGWLYSKNYYGGWMQSQSGIGALSMSESSIGLVATSGTPYTQDQIAKLDAAGLHSAASGRTAGLCSTAENAPGAIGMSMSHIGVVGTSGVSYTDAQLQALDGAGIHAAANGKTTGLCAQAESAPGAVGMSMSHIGVVGTSGVGYTDAQLLALDAAGIHAAAKGPTTGLCSQAETGPAVVGMSASSGLIGVVGSYAVGDALVEAGKAANMPPTGVWGRAANAIGVWGQSDTSIGVLGKSKSGPGVVAESETGPALVVNGPMQSEMAGNGVIKRRSDSGIVICPGMTADAHVSITFTSNPNGRGDDGNATSFWVERQPGTGFVVHLSQRSKLDVSFSYFIVNPIG